VHQAHVSSVRAALGRRSRVAGTRAALRALTLRPWRGRERLTTSTVLRPRVYVPSGWDLPQQHLFTAPDQHAAHGRV